MISGKPVQTDPNTYTTKRDAFNHVTFSPVENNRPCAWKYNSSPVSPVVSWSGRCSDFLAAAACSRLVEAVSSLAACAGDWQTAWQGAAYRRGIVEARLFQFKVLGKVGQSGQRNPVLSAPQMASLFAARFFFTFGDSPVEETC